MTNYIGIKNITQKGKPIKISPKKTIYAAKKDLNLSFNLNSNKMKISLLIIALFIFSLATVLP